jgi:transcriptional regulator with XRE-family HTH domain
MNETTNPAAIVTRDYREKMGLTYRAFAEALNEHLVHTSISHVSVQNWEKGMLEPKMDFLWIILINHDDWRADWAVDMLCAVLPEAFSPVIDHKLMVPSDRVVAYEAAR